MIKKRWGYLLGSFYIICFTVGMLRIEGYLGAFGVAPLALMGHKSSIAYLYDCFSFENYHPYLSKFWKRRGAQAEIPEFQRLYGEDLLSSNPAEGVVFLAKAAAGKDYYAAAVLARRYADPDFPMRNRELAKYYQNLADQLMPTSQRAFKQ